MPVITAGTTSAIWGLSSETGIITQSVGAKIAREIKAEKNETGDDTLIAWFNPTQKYTISGVIIGSTGIAAAMPGIALTINNTNLINGVSAGGIYVDDVDVPRTNVDFKKITATATQRPLVA